MAEDTKVIGILGGTGAFGSGLALRLARSGYSVLIGSREAERGKKAAHELSEPNLTGAANREVAHQADLIIVAVPFDGRDQVLKDVQLNLKGKIVVDATVPLNRPKVDVVYLRATQSAATQMQLLLGPDVKVISAFQNVAAAKLRTMDPIECYVLVTGDDQVSKDQVINMVERMGMVALDAGVLANSVVAEALTPVLIQIDRSLETETEVHVTGIYRKEK